MLLQSTRTWGAFLARRHVDTINIVCNVAITETGRDWRWTNEETEIVGVVRNTEVHVDREFAADVEAGRCVRGDTLLVLRQADVRQQGG